MNDHHHHDHRTLGRAPTAALVFALLAALVVGMFQVGNPRHARAGGTPIYGEDRVFSMKVDAGTAALICTGVSGAKLRIKTLSIQNATTGYVTLQDSAATPVFHRMVIQATAAQEVPPSQLGGGILLAVTGSGLYARADSGTGIVVVNGTYNAE